MKHVVGMAALLTLAVIALTQAVCYAVWGGSEEVYDLSIVATGVLIPLVTCFPISIVLLRQRGQIARTLSELEQAHRDLREASSRDPMTGLLHRQAFFERLTAHVCGAGAFLMIDVDHFKSINDTSGHGAGDEALRLIAAALAEVAGHTNVVARFGGEEFCLFSPVPGAMEGHKLAERIRRRIGKLDFAPGGARRRLTVSIGVADAASFGDAQSAIGAADAALYEAKRQGRNRVVVTLPAKADPPARNVA
jgi:diguanylate cyclase (GGDEF)-like protein